MLPATLIGHKDVGVLNFTIFSGRKPGQSKMQTIRLKNELPNGKLIYLKTPCFCAWVFSLRRSVSSIRPGRYQTSYLDVQIDEQ